MIKTIEQARASFCLKKVKDFLSNNPTNEKKDKFKRNGMRLAQMVVSNGLLSTLAFYKAKDERIYIYEIVNEWLKKSKYIKNDALEELIEGDVNKLRLATIEALAIAEWLKRIIEVEVE